MVSIPDWTKLIRVVDGPEKEYPASLNKYKKQQELRAIKQAEEEGYFFVPSGDYLLQNFDPKIKKKLKHIYHVHLVGVHLRKLGDIPLCHKLTICILSNNYLTKIDGLSCCLQLIKLDLHSNQLTTIPNTPFWSGLTKLHALYLHDNPLGKFDTLQSLSACADLSILTLYDTPLSLKKNYRHHVVNSIWTLKALDHHVIADEEIIEDALFGGHFSALSSSFQLDLCPPSPQNSSYEEELHIFQELKTKINAILSKHSPVIIIQKYLRGYFTRKRHGLVHKPIRQKVAPKGELQPPSTHITILEPSSTQPKFTPASELVPSKITEREQSGLVPPSTPIPTLDDFYTTSFVMDPSGKVRQQIFINLTKLQDSALQALHDESATNLDPTTGRTTRRTADHTTRERKKTREKEKQEKKIMKRAMSVKQFFGPVVDIQRDDHDDKDDRLSDDENVPITHYRLRGHRPAIFLADPTTEMILSRMEDGKRVRESEAEIFKRVYSKPVPKVTPFAFSNNNQRIFSRVHGTMGLSCLVAVQKAYKEREKAEKTMAKMEHILTLRSQRLRAKERIQMYHDEKRNFALQKRDQDRARFLEQLEKQELKRLNYLDKQQEVKGRMTDLSKSVRADNTFVTEFMSHHTSVSKALLRHDRQASREERHSSYKNRVQSLRSAELDQQDIVKKYLEHRQQQLQAKSCMSRNNINLQILQETTERLIESKQRVAHKKAKSEKVQAFYPLPYSTVTPFTSSATEQMLKYEGNIV